MAMEPGAPSGGSASEMAGEIHSKLGQFADLVGSKFPEEGQALTQLVQQFQSIVESLGSAPGGEGPQGPPMPGTTSPEAGASGAKPAL